jgi:hypothetical protein
MAVKGDHDPVLMGAHRDASGSDFRPRPGPKPGGRSAAAGHPDPDDPQPPASTMSEEELVRWWKANGGTVQVGGGRGYTGKLKE